MINSHKRLSFFCSIAISRKRCGSKRYKGAIEENRCRWGGLMASIIWAMHKRKRHVTFLNIPPCERFLIVHSMINSDIVNLTKGNNWVCFIVSSIPHNMTQAMVVIENSSNLTSVRSRGTIHYDSRIHRTGRWCNPKGGFGNIVAHVKLNHYMKNKECAYTATYGYYRRWGDS